MKKYLLFGLITTFSLVFSSCNSESAVKTVVIDFEDVILTEAGITGLTSFVSGNATFSLNGTEFWEGGIVCSSNTDSTTAGYENQYSSISANGALKSKKYAVLYQPGTISVNPSKVYNYKLKSMMVNNSTYAYLDMKFGSLYSKKFAAGDWFKLIIAGYKNEVETAKVEFYLADFRDGKTILVNNWTKVVLEKLNEVDKIKFTMESSDSGEWGINTPAYACIDNIEFEETEIENTSTK